jgi:serine protease Do
MKSFLRVLTAAAVLAAATPVPARAAAADTAASLQDAFAQVAQSVKPSVVSVTSVHVENVQVVTPEFFFGDPFQDFFGDDEARPGPRRNPRGQAPRQFQRRFQGLGSGVVIDERGYVLTNEHVVHGADELTVTFQTPEEKKYPAKVVGADPRTDLAVLKIQGKDKFPAAALADSDRVRVGDWAVAVGSPFGLEQTVTVGVVSAVRQSLNIEGVNYANLLQTDAAINRGNSGGPLVNLKGEVMGINTAIYAPTGVFAGIGFAIPSNRAKEVMSQLIEKGRVVRGWMGIEVMPLDEVLAKQFSVPDGKGVLVNNVLPGSPAQSAGMRRGDVVVEFNGRRTVTQDALLDAVGHTPPKTKVEVKVMREGKPMTLSLTAGEAPAGAEASPDEGGPAQPAPSAPGGVEWEGMRVVALTPALAERFGFPAKESGVVAAEVASGGRAEAAGLMEGDLISSLNRKKTPDPAAFLAAAKAADPRKGLVFDVFRKGRWIYLTYKEPQ